MLQAQAQVALRRGQDPEIAACQFLLLAVIALPLIPISIAAVYRARERITVGGTQ